MLLRLLSICLATVLLSSILLFIYFRTKVAKVEEKLEIMFNLIQSHAEQKVNTNLELRNLQLQRFKINDLIDKFNIAEKQNEVNISIIKENLTEIENELN